MLDELRLVFAHPEEVILLAHALDRTSCLRAFLVHQIFFRPEAFGPFRIPALVLVLVDVTLIVKALQCLTYDLGMTWLCSPNEIIVFYMKVRE